MMKSNKKFLSIFLVLIFVFGMFSVVSTSFAYAEKTAAEPTVLYIDTEADFSAFMNNATYQHFSNLTVVLNTDIYMQRRGELSTTETEGLTTFSGTFDGNGHTISGINLQTVGKFQNGFFGYIQSGAVIKNLNISDAKITADNSNYVGILAHTNRGTISNVKVNGSIATSSALVGGLVGANLGTIENSYIYYNVKLSNATAGFGGIVAHNSGIVEIAEGEVTTSKQIEGTITNTFFNGNGEIVEIVEGEVTTSQQIEGTITNTFFNGKAYDSENNLITPNYYKPPNISAVSPEADNKGIYTKDREFLLQDADGNYIINNIFGIMFLSSLPDGNAKQSAEINIFNLNLNNEILGIINGTATGVPTLNRNGYGFYNANTYHKTLISSPKAHTEGVVSIVTGTISGAGTKSSPYLVTSAVDLQTVAEGEEYHKEDVFIKLTRSISLSHAAEYFQPQFANFKGTFDGGNHAISGLSKTLFANNEGTVKNLYVVGALNEGQAVLAETNSGIIENIEVNALLLVSGQSALVGANLGAIRQSTIYATKEASVSNISAVANTMGSDTINTATISTVRNMSQFAFIGEYSGGTITNCFNNNNYWNHENQTISGITYSVAYSDASGYAVSQDIKNINDLTTKEHNGNWKWGAADNTWGFVYGQEKDIPTLIFASDAIAAYKSVVKADGKNANQTYAPNKTYEANAATAKSYCTSYKGKASAVWYTTEDKTTAFTGDFKDAGTYYVDITIAPTVEKSGCFVSGSIHIAKANMELLVDDMGKIAGIISGEGNDGNTVTYNGKIFSLNDLANEFNKILIDKGAEVPATVGLKIESYLPYSRVPGLVPQEMKAAGTYTLNLEIEHKNYNINLNAFSRVLFKIDRKKIEITPHAAESLKYNTDIGIVEYTASGICEGEVFDDMDKTALAYTTNYVKGKTEITNGAKNQKITVVEKEGHIFSNNYEVSGLSCFFEVIKGDIPSEGLAFNSANPTYNGKYHTLTVEGAPKDSTIKYFVSNSDVSVPTLGYIDCGTYEYRAVIALNSNYNDKTLNATLTIKQANITLTAKTYTITYKEKVPSFGLEDYELFAREDGKAEAIGVPTFSCTYINGVSDANATGYEITFQIASLNNYIVNKKNGMLFVDKAERTVTLKNNTHIANGNQFEPIYMFGTQQLAASYIIGASYYRNDGNITDIWTLVDSAVAVGRYKVVVTVKEDVNYKESISSCLFTISQKSLNGISLGYDGSAIGNEYTYDGKNHIINYLGTLPTDGKFEVSYGYSYKGQNYTQDYPIMIKNAGDYTDITIAIKDSNNIYLPLELNIDKITILRAHIVIKDIPNKKYNTAAVVPTITAESQVYDELKFSYKVYLGGELYEETIINPNKYELEIACDNDNYYISERKTFVVEKNIVTLDLSKHQAIIKEYGTVKNKFEQTISFELEGIAVSLPINFSIDTTAGYLTAKEYKLSDALPIIINGASAIEFNIINGDAKLKVTRKIIKFRWWDGITDFSKEYIYKGSDILKQTYKVAESELDDFRVGTNDIGLSFRCDTAVKNVGEYCFRPVINNNNYTYGADASTFPIAVKPAPLNIAVYTYTIKFGEQIPRISGKITGVLGTDNIVPSYSANYTADNSPGNYITTASYENPNYIVTITNGTLTVELGEIKNAAIELQTFVYTGQPVLPTISGLPTGASVIFTEELPKNVGTHTVSATITAKNYANKIVSGTIIITAAAPTIVMLKWQLAYKDDTQLTNADIQGSASFGGVAVDGVFSFSTPQMLKYGEHAYIVTFTPKSPNFSAVNNIIYTITSYLTEEDISILPVGGEVVGDELVVTDSENITISIGNVNSVTNKCELYVNGKLIENGVYIVETSVVGLLVEIKFNGAVIRSQTLNVRFEAPTPPVEPPEEPTPPTPEPKKDSNLGLIIWLSVGGGALIIVAAVVAVIIVKKKKNKSANQNYYTNTP